MLIRKTFSYLIHFFARSNLIFKVFQLVVDEVYKKTFTVEHKNQKMIFFSMILHTSEIFLMQFLRLHYNPNNS